MRSHDTSSPSRSSVRRIVTPATLLAVTVLSTLLPAQVCRKALGFDGQQDGVLVSNSAGFPVSVLTVSAWIRLASVPPGGCHQGTIVSYGEDDATDTVPWQISIIGTANGNLARKFVFSSESPDHGNGGESLTTNALMSVDCWTHVAATRDGSQVTVYVNGVKDATTTFAGQPFTHDQTHAIGAAFSGCDANAWANWFHGRIDDVAVWNRALSEAEIAVVYANGVNASDTGLVGYWPFDDGAGQVASDASPNGNHGQLGLQAAADGADPTWVTEQHTPGAFQSFGTSCQGTNGLPAHAAGGTPEIDQLITWDLTNARANTAAALLVGFVQQNIDLGVIQMPNCFLYTQPVLVLSGSTDNAGAASKAYRISCRAALVGVKVYSQWAILDPGVPHPLQVATTNGVEMTVGGCR